ncbi:MAG: hypothetical protein GX963_09110 [Bacteroidales bacterium]|nr:hypothetical protein [Bacteroidales bacterium]
MQATKEISFEEIKSLMNDKYYLLFVDYNDSLDEHADKLQEALETGTTEPIMGLIDWSFDEILSLDNEKKELKEKIQKKFDITEEEADGLMEKYECEIQDYIYNHDESTPIKDLFRNTSKQVVFYDTGYEMESESWSWSDEEILEEVERIKKIFNVTTSKYDENIRVMITQATYGGQLVVYFYEKIDDLLPEDPEKDFTKVDFKDASIAIIDVYGGSGDHTELIEHSFSLPFKRKNLTIDKTIKYNYTYSVCGLMSDWCSNTIVKLSHEKAEGEIKESRMNAHKAKEAKYNEVFAQGKCSAGDMDINRHRGVYYRNEYPCGNKCPHCGTFWID